MSKTRQWSGTCINTHKTWSGRADSQAPWLWAHSKQPGARKYVRADVSGLRCDFPWLFLFQYQDIHLYTYMNCNFFKSLTGQAPCLNIQSYVLVIFDELLLAHIVSSQNCCQTLSDGESQVFLLMKVWQWHNPAAGKKYTSVQVFLCTRQQRKSNITSIQHVFFCIGVKYWELWIFILDLCWLPLQQSCCSTKSKF